MLFYVNTNHYRYWKKLERCIYQRNQNPNDCDLGMDLKWIVIDILVLVQ
jgi:hypothetical protein